jgi:signal transduction histidine kinase/DNA-binding response OmpR family regulator
MRIALFLLASLLLPGALAASPEEGMPPMRAWSDDAAGQQNWQVRTLPNGLMAFANQRGIALFDGERFEQVDGPGGIIYDFWAGPDQRIYLATGRALGYLQPDARREWQFVPLPLPAAAPPPGDIGRVVFAYGRVFFLSRTLLLSHHPRAGWRWREAAGFYAELRLRDDRLLLYEDGSGWLQYDLAREEFTPADEPGLPVTGLAATSEQPGSPWYATDRRTIYHHQDGRWAPFVAHAPAGWLEDRIEALARLPSGELAVGTRFGGLYQFAPDGTLTRRIAPALLPGARITDIEVDAEGGLWLTLDGGIARLEPDNTLTRFDRDLGATQVERIRRIDGVLYLATRQGLRKLVPGAAPGLPARFVDSVIRRDSSWDLLATPHGTLAGTGSGLKLLPPGAEGSALDLIPGRRVSSLTQADDGWIYAIAGREVRRLRWNGQAFAVDPQAVTLVPMFDGRWHAGALWVSLDGGGAWRLDDLDRWPQLSTRAYGDEPERRHFRVGFASDERGLLLLSDGKPWRVDGDRLRLDKGFPSGFEYEQLAQDGSGDRWSIGTGGPVTRLQPLPGGGYRLAATLAGRFALPERHLHADTDGTVWLADNSGVVRLSGTPQSAPLTARPLLRGVRDASGDLLLGGAGTDAAPPAIDLPARHRHLDLQLALPSWQADRPARWQHRVGDGEWVAMEGPQLRLELDAGVNRVEIQATDGSGRASAPLLLRLSVAPFWHESLRARAAGGLLLLALLGGSAWAYGRWRTRRLERERARLERLVAERTADVRRQAEEIRALSEARTRFFANVSHEFRTPLTLVLGPLGDALDGRFGALPAGLAAALETARASARRLLRMVGELLDLSRLAAGRFELRVAEHDLAEQLRRELAAFERQAHARGIDLAGEGLADPLLLWYDADQLERMVSNLLSNALKFTPVGGHVRLRLVPTAQEVGIEVEDNGPGIAPEEQARVFERFYQGAVASPPESPGTGIGLALVRELMELHHGRAELISSPGQGSCFALWLRRGHAHFDAAQLCPPPLPERDGAPARASASDSEQAAATRPTLLVVDDHAELRRYLADRLGDAYQVVAARNGEEALACIAESLPDVVVSDVMMPGVDGIELARALRRDPETAGVPLLLLSARAQKRDIVAGLDAGADDYLTKPFDTSELIARIEALLESRRRLRQQIAADQAAATGSAAAAGPVEDAMPTPIEAAAQRFTERLEQALERHLGDPAFGVAELATALHVDRATLFRRVRGSFQTTPSELLRERRLARAEALLRARSGNVSEIAYAVGFDNLSHFSQAFRKRYGVAPSSLL